MFSQVGRILQGRKGLEGFLSKITGGDLHSRETRAVARWRIAKVIF